MSRFQSRRLCWIVLLAVLAALTVVPHQPGEFAVGHAYADDDGGGDDDGGDDGGGRSSSRGGDRYLGPGRGQGPNLFRLLRRQFGQTGQRQPRRARPRAVAPQLFRPNEIVAVGLTPDQVNQLTAAGFGVTERVALRQVSGDLVRLSLPQGVSTDAAVDQVRTIAPGAGVDLNHFYRPSDVGDCGGRPCVAPSLVGWPAGIQVPQACKGQDVTVGLIDTAINPDHLTFAGSRLELIRLGAETRKESGRQHGTAVAGLLIGRARGATPGLLPEARLVAVDVFEPAGREDARTDAFWLVQAIDLLADRKVDVLNLSLSGPENAVLQRAISAAHGRDIVLVAAAGNEGPRAKPVFPAAYAEVIAVTAVDRQKNVYRRANRGDHIDLAAPGVNVWTAASISGARPKTGTSFAAPFVTAAAALAKSSGISGAKNIEQHLVRTAEDLGDSGKDQVFGWGLLNVADICSKPPSNP